MEDQCKHGKVTRNCYACHIDHVYSKTELDTLNESLSELKIRLSKLEQYLRLQADHNKLQQTIITELANHINELQEHRKKQIDENRAVSKHLTDLDESYQGLSHELRNLLEKLSDNDFVKFDPADYTDEDDESKKSVTFDLGNGNRTEVRFVGNVTIPKETLCMDKFTKPKTTGLTLEEAITAFKTGKKIKRKAYWCDTLFMQLHNRESCSMDINDIMNDDWEILE